MLTPLKIREYDRCETSNVAAFRGSFGGAKSAALASGLWLLFSSPIGATENVDFKVDLSVNGVSAKTSGDTIRVPANAKTIGVRISREAGSSKAVSESFRYKLEGVDRDWQRLYSDMGFVVRFLSVSDDLVSHNYFFVAGDSPGWNGTLSGSPPVHRREMVKVPPGAERLSLVISSAGGPTVIGIYAAENISVFRQLKEGSLQPLFDTRGFDLAASAGASDIPFGWVRDGVHASMATIVHLRKSDHSITAFGIIDSDANAHAEWRLDRPAEIPVVPGETLVIEWEEMYSIGMVGNVDTTYLCPPPGEYQLLVAANSPGSVNGALKIIRVVVYRPYWMQPWFWIVVSLLVLIVAAFVARAIIRARIRRYLKGLEQERAVERERLRIARDLHDDLGARLTHISFISGRAGSSKITLEESQNRLLNISNVTRDLIASLYETVWSVDPENDHLDESISFLTQMIENLCEAASMRCRIRVPDSVPEKTVASDIRHNTSLAVKEVVNNAIKHSGASELIARFEIVAEALLIEIADNGCGFDLEESQRGNGLKNIRDRMSIIKAGIDFITAPGKGTIVKLRCPFSIKET